MKSSLNIIMVLVLLLSAFTLSYAEEQDEQAGKRPPRPNFSSVDSDGNGEVSLDEFSLQALPHGDHETIFSEIDSDSDGVITEQEYSDHRPPRPPKRQ